MTWGFVFTGREGSMKVKSYTLHSSEVWTRRGCKLNSYQREFTEVSKVLDLVRVENLQGVYDKVLSLKVHRVLFDRKDPIHLEPFENNTK